MLCYNNFDYTNIMFFLVQETSEETEHISVEMAEVVESLGKLKDEMIKIDVAYRKIENVVKEKKIEADVVISLSESNY